MSSHALVGLVAGLVAAPELHSVMVLRHGVVIAEGWAAPYTRERPHAMFSVSKSFTSTAIGFARAEGLLGLDDLVLDHFVDEAPVRPDENLRRMRVRDLLTMTTGHDVAPDDEVFGQADWVRGFLAQPVPRVPGTHFVYNTPASYMLSALVQRLTGERVLTYLTPRLFEPLGIVGATWEQSPSGVDVGGFGLSVTTEDLACFGQLYLQDGRWDGRQVLPAGWAREATASQVVSGNGPAGDGPARDEPSSDWDQGYGFQFWRNREGGFRADGAFGQLSIVLPEQDMVVALTSAVPDMSVTFALVRAHLRSVGAGAVPADPATHAKLAGQLAAMRLVDTPTGSATSPASVRIAGRTVRFGPNAIGLDDAVLEPGVDRDRLTVRAAGQSLTVDVGHERGLPARIPGASRSRAVEDALVSGVWTGVDEYTVAIRLLDSPLLVTAVATFAGDDVLVRPSVNVSFDGPGLPVITGRVGG